MSGPAAPAPDDLLDDLAHTLPGPVLEFGGWRRAAASGGRAVTPWRRDARAAGAIAAGTTAGLPAGTWASAAVHLARGRSGTLADLHAAWTRLAPGGMLAVEGANDEGAQGWIRRLRGWCGGDPVATAARAHRRAAVFIRTAAAGPPAPEPQSVPADAEPGAPALTVPAGVFSGDGLDEGTAAMLAHLATVPAAATVLDLGCGAGHLGLWCLRRWPGCTTVLADADARAAAGAQANADVLGVAGRATVLWADQHDPLPGGCALAVVNPPAHAGNELNLAAGIAMCLQAADRLADGGTLLVVANRRLPYEAPLARVGTVAASDGASGFKILSVRRGAAHG